MSKALQILIIEDERILAETIASMVEDLGHTVVGKANTIVKALDYIEHKSFDLAILDINLKMGNEGIEIGKLLFEKSKPFFFLTSYTDSSTLHQAKAVRPGAYVVKPFTEQDLFVAIEMTATNIEEENSSSVIVRKGNAYARINVDDIGYLKAENVYTELYTNQKKWLKRGTLKDSLEEINDEDFVQIHRSYAVNLRNITGWSTRVIHVNGEEIPVSRRLWDETKHLLEERFKKA